MPQNRVQTPYENQIPRRNSRKRKKKKSKKGLVITLIIIGVLLIAGIVFAVVAKSKLDDLKKDANVLKNELSVCAGHAKAMNPDGVQASSDRIEKINGALQEKLDSGFWNFVEKIPWVGSDVTTAKNLLQSLDIVTGKIIGPFCKLIRDYPLTSLKANESDIDVSILIKYLDFMDEIEPSIDEIKEKLGTVEFKIAKFSFDNYVGKLNSAIEALDSFRNYKMLLRAFLGDGYTDKKYLIMAQNSTEIRASGGFPGSMGLIEIHDGLLSVGDFNEVSAFLFRTNNTPEADITEREVELFRDMYASMAHDACYNPHFPKVAYITKVGYENMNGGTLNGVLSLTPSVVQDILQATNTTVTLFDGTVLDGTNATRVIERDLYIKYMADDASAAQNNLLVDALFVETAAKALKSLFGNLNPETLLKYLQLFKVNGEKRTMMLWLDDVEDEQFCKDTGFSGSLNYDPEHPAAGVYFSCCDPSKLGMFMEINTDVGKPKKRDDGSMEYTVKVTLNNYLNEAAGEITSTYILGNNDGAIQSYVYFFAPAGGTISDFSSSDNMDIMTSDYEGLQVLYAIDEFLYPGTPVTVTYKVTTAPGVTEPLKIETTPTLQEYR